MAPALAPPAAAAAAPTTLAMQQTDVLGPHAHNARSVDGALSRANAQGLVQAVLPEAVGMMVQAATNASTNASGAEDPQSAESAKRVLLSLQHAAARIVAKINECAARVPPTPTPEVVTALYAVSFSLYDAFTRAGRSNVEGSVHRALHARFAARSSDAAQDLAARSLSCSVAELHAARDEFFKSLAKQVAECAERAVAAGWAEVGLALVDRVSLLASRTVPAVVAPKPALMTAAEAHAAAAAEGQLRAENAASASGACTTGL